MTKNKWPKIVKELKKIKQPDSYVFLLIATKYGVTLQTIVNEWYNLNT